ncbi:MAG: class I SAM-dependent methyltransferase [Candidatus Nanohalobium sp.]
MTDYNDSDSYSDDRYGSLGGMRILEREREHYEKILERLGADTGSTVLELGSNNALMSEHLSKQGYEMHCGDVERKPLMDAREEERTVQQYQVDGHRLPFQEDSFDYVIMPRMLHLDVVDEEEVIEEVSRVAEKGFAFDVFSRGSGRALYNSTMHKLDKSMPKSSLASKYEITGSGPIEGWLEDYDDVETFSDFAIPFGAYRNSENEIWVKMVEEVNDIFEKWGKKDMPDPNSVIYTAVDMKEEKDQ